MIKVLLIVNNLGKVRIGKFYETISNQPSIKLIVTEADKQQDIIKKLFELVKQPDGRKGHFIKDKDGIYDKKATIIMRQYATLHFIMVIDQDESELSSLDLIQIIVEGCDSLFENVCELDMVYFSDKINALIDEIIIGGHVIETKISEVLAVLKATQQHQDKPNA